MKILVKSAISIAALLGSCTLYAGNLELNVSNNSKYDVSTHCTTELTGAIGAVAKVIDGVQYGTIGIDVITMSYNTPAVLIEKGGKWQYEFTPGYLSEPTDGHTTCYFDVKKSDEETRYVAVEFDSKLDEKKENSKANITVSGEGNINIGGDVINITNLESEPHWYSTYQPQQ